MLLPIAVVIAAVAPSLIPAVWGAQFSAATAPLLILLPGVLAMSIQRPIGQYFVRTKRSSIMNVRALVATVVNIALCLVLIPPWSASGAALASTLAYIVYAGVSVVAYQRQTGEGVAAVWAASGQSLRPLGRLRRDKEGDSGVR